ITMSRMNATSASLALLFGTADFASSGESVLLSSPGLPGAITDGPDVPAWPPPSPSSPVQAGTASTAATHGTTIHLRTEYSSDSRARATVRGSHSLVTRPCLRQ